MLEKPKKEDGGQEAPREGERMNKEDIQAARERCEVATPGDWFFNSYDAIWEAGKGDDSERIASVSHLEYDDEGDEVPSHGDEIFGPRSAEARANGEFIAHACSDLPAALEALEEAERKWNLTVGDRDACLGELAKAERERDGYKALAKRFATSLHYKDIH